MASSNIGRYQKLDVGALWNNQAREDFFGYSEVTAQYIQRTINVQSHIQKKDIISYRKSNLGPSTEMFCNLYRGFPTNPHDMVTHPSNHVPETNALLETRT